LIEWHKFATIYEPSGKYELGDAATGNDVGKLVFVRDNKDQPWRGPFELLSCNDQLIPPYHVRKGPNFTAGFIEARLAVRKNDVKEPLVAPNYRYQIGDVATADDVGKMVFLRGKKDHPWHGPYQLLNFAAGLEARLAVSISKDDVPDPIAEDGDSDKAKAEEDDRADRLEQKAKAHAQLAKRVLGQFAEFGYEDAVEYAKSVPRSHYDYWQDESANEEMERLWGAMERVLHLSPIAGLKMEAEELKGIYTSAFACGVRDYLEVYGE
jgi:hypothetical protein